MLGSIWNGGRGRVWGMRMGVGVGGGGDGVCGCGWVIVRMEWRDVVVVVGGGGA